LARPLSSIDPTMSLGRGSLLTVLHPHCSIRLQHEYIGFRCRLEQSLPLLDQSILPTTDDEAIDAVPSVLRMEREKERADAAAMEDDHETGDGTRAPAADQDAIMANEATQPRAPVDMDKVFGILVRNATEEFGFAPRDVYSGTFDLPRTRIQHATEVMKIDYPKSKTLSKRSLRGVNCPISLTMWLPCAHSNA